MAPISHKQRKVWKQSNVAFAMASGAVQRPGINLPKVSRYGGFSPTSTETTPLQVVLRNAGRGRTRKPSMPKMPWDEEPSQ